MARSKLYRGLSCVEDNRRYIYTVLVFNSRFHACVLVPLEVLVGLRKLLFLEKKTRSTFMEHLNMPSHAHSEVDNQYFNSQ